MLSFYTHLYSPPTGYFGPTATVSLVRLGKLYLFFIISKVNINHKICIPAVQDEKIMIMTTTTTTIIKMIMGTIFSFLLFYVVCFCVYMMIFIDVLF